MKNNQNLIILKITIISIICNFSIVYAQIQPPEIKFEGINENWFYISKDSNFVKSPKDLWSSPYWGRHPTEIIQNNNNIYIQELVFSQSPYGGIEGVLVHCLNMNSGNPNWVFHSNTYSGNVFRESYPPGSLNILNNKYIQLIGFKDVDSIDFKKPLWFGFNGNPVKTILDLETGVMLEKKFSQDTTKSTYNSANFHNNIWTLSDENVVLFAKNIYKENNELINSIDLYNIDENMNIETPYFNKIGYYTNLNIPIYKSTTPYFNRLTKDSLIVLFSKIDTTDTKQSPKELVMKIVNISSENNIHTVKIIDMSELIYYPQSVYNDDIYSIVKDENIFILQNPEEISGSHSKFYWLGWYNKNGDKKGKIDKFSNDEGDYYSHIYPIGVKDGIAYIAGYIHGVYDILKINPDSNKFKKIGQLSIENMKDINNIHIENAEFLLNEKLLLCIKIKTNNEINRETNFSFYFSFNMSDLGILTSLKESSKIDNYVYISPNPTRNKFRINTIKPFSGSLELLDMNGRKIYIEKIINKTTHNIQLENVSNGYYILKGVSEFGDIFIRKIHIAK